MAIFKAHICARGSPCDYSPGGGGCQHNKPSEATGRGNEK
jgi:hypothetical protein